MARLGLVAGGLLLGLLAAEWVARGVDPGGAADLLFNATDNAPDGLYTSDRQLLHRPTAGLAVTQTSLGYRVHLRINSYSCRGPEPGPKEKARWLATGDSFTFAEQVDEEDTFAQRLARSRDVEVINAGADGYGTIQARLRYEDLDPKLGIDKVLLTFFVGNDLSDDYLYPVLARQSEGISEEVPLRSLQPDPLIAFLSRHSYLYGQWRMRQRRERLSGANDSERQRWQNELRMFTAAGSDWMDKHAWASRKALKDLRDAVAARGDTLLVAVAPPAFEVVPERAEATFTLVGLGDEKLALDGPADTVKAMLGELGIATCDLVAPLRAAVAEGRPVYLRYDGHWTPEGHAVVAEALNACLSGG